jgi:hypothetical protein
MDAIYIERWVTFHVVARQVEHRNVDRRRQASKRQVYLLVVLAGLVGEVAGRVDGG